MKKFVKGKDYSDLKWQEAIKRPIPVKVCQIKEEFVVHTLEGDMKGKAEDYLMAGINGELYPCDKEIFEKTYDIQEEK